MARGNRSNSESDSNSTTGANQTASKPGNNSNNNNSNNSTSKNSSNRLTQQQQQYLRELNRTHITNNHPDDTPHYSATDFNHYSDAFLRDYKDRYRIDTPDNMTLAGYILQSPLGQKTQSFKNNIIHKQRTTRRDLVAAVTLHFNSSSNNTVKEMDSIPNFIYKVKMKNLKFKFEQSKG